MLVHEDIHEDLLKKLQESIIEYFGNDVKSSADFGRLCPNHYILKWNDENFCLIE